MKQNFAMIKLIQLMLFLWCGVVANAQDNATRTIVNSSTTIGPTLSMVPSTATRTIVNSRMTIGPTLSMVPSTATRTIVNSRMIVGPTPSMAPSTGSMKGVSAVVLIVIVVLIALIVVITVFLRMTYRRRNHWQSKRPAKAALVRDRNAPRCTQPSKPFAREASKNLGVDELGENYDTVNYGYIGVPPVCGRGADFKEDKQVPGVTVLETSSLANVQPPSPLSHLTEVTVESYCRSSISSRSLDRTEGRRVNQSVFYNNIAEEEDNIPISKLKEKSIVKKIITTEGGDMKIDDITLNIGAGCLAKDTEITLIKDDQNFSFKSLLDLGLVDTAPRVVELLPDGLKFLKPADLAIKFETAVSDSELVILHGSYNREYQRTVWELVTNDIEDSTAEGVVNMKINGFCFFCYILTIRGEIARILSHLNRSFSSCAYAFYRRLPPMNTIDISVVMLSEFVDEKKKEDIKQLKDHFEEGYIKGDKGMLKSVYTDRCLEMRLDFPGIESTPFPFKVNQPELDKDGFVIDYFKGMEIERPASGVVKISEVHQDAENKLLWKLNVHEMEQEITVDIAQEHSTEPDPEPEVVYRTTRLTSREISRMSRMIAGDWDSLAGLMDIPYSEREQIRINHAKYPAIHLKAEQIFELFNGSQDFGRHTLEKCVEELERCDLKNEMLPVENEIAEEVEAPPSQPEVHSCESDVVLRNTPLSSREMYRLSRRITVDWDSLAGLMDIAREQRDDIRCNTIYNDERARAEKILSIFNNKEDFSREKLADCLQGIKKLDLIRPIEIGAWRSL